MINVKKFVKISSSKSSIWWYLPLMIPHKPKLNCFWKNDVYCIAYDITEKKIMDKTNLSGSVYDKVGYDTKKYNDVCLVELVKNYSIRQQDPFKNYEQWRRWVLLRPHSTFIGIYQQKIMRNDCVFHQNYVQADTKRALLGCFDSATIYLGSFRFR